MLLLLVVTTTLLALAEAAGDMRAEPATSIGRQLLTFGHGLFHGGSSTSYASAYAGPGYYNRGPYYDPYYAGAGYGYGGRCV